MVDAKGVCAYRLGHYRVSNLFHPLVVPQAADYLKRIDRAAYTTLTTVPVHFHRQQKQFEVLARTAPDSHGCII